ncbi:MAG: radical SAM protein, partial [Kiritimatiellaeota bacterium]|nr:radical SAM protein [Kiritimatiellota bacterium]
RCAYCIVPDTRGPPRSRPLAEILAEAGTLLGAGHRELVVTGCNIACWREGKLRLPDLLAKLAAIVPWPSARLRLGSVEPAGVEREVVDIVAQIPAFCRFLHFPLQHADPRILRAMRRRYTPDAYRALCEHTLKKIPGVALGADVITGFPGETEGAFAALRDFISSIPFANLHVFPYSERPGTPAAAMPGVVPRETRKARARELIALGVWQRRAFATTHVDVPQRVLVERVASGVGTGWTDTYVACRVPGLAPACLDEIVDFTPSSIGGLNRAETLL